MRCRILLIVLLCIFSAKTNAQEIEVIQFSDLDRLIKEEKEEIRVFNFWATWCKPCVVELPYFERLKANYDGPLTVYLISMDFVEDLDTKVTTFVRKKQLKSEIKLLDETDYNSFIDRIDSDWSGAIPATLFVDASDGRKMFYEGEIEEEELLEKFNRFVD